MCTKNSFLTLAECSWNLHFVMRAAPDQMSFLSLKQVLAFEAIFDLSAEQPH
jgi:hypothetical protein